MCSIHKWSHLAEYYLEDFNTSIVHMRLFYFKWDMQSNCHSVLLLYMHVLFTCFCDCLLRTNYYQTADIIVAKATIIVALVCYIAKYLLTAYIPQKRMCLHYNIFLIKTCNKSIEVYWFVHNQFFLNYVNQIYLLYGSFGDQNLCILYSVINYIILARSLYL